MPEPTEQWFIANATELTWEGAPGWGRHVQFQRRGEPFPDYGVNIQVLEPGERSTLYHAEGGQEGFLVVKGSCTLLVDGEERALKAWDFFHCPAWTRHGFVNGGDETCVIVMTGARSDGATPECVYPADERAQAHGMGVTEETWDAEVAYADTPPNEDEPYRPGTLPGA